MRYHFDRRWRVAPHLENPGLREIRPVPSIPQVRGFRTTAPLRELPRLLHSIRAHDWPNTAFLGLLRFAMTSSISPERVGAWTSTDPLFKSRSVGHAQHGKQ